MIHATWQQLQNWADRFTSDQAEAVLAEMRESAEFMRSISGTEPIDTGCPHCDSHEVQLANVTTERDEALQVADEAQADMVEAKKLRDEYGRSLSRISHAFEPVGPPMAPTLLADYATKWIADARDFRTDVQAKVVSGPLENHVEWTTERGDLLSKIDNQRAELARMHERESKVAQREREAEDAAAKAEWTLLERMRQGSEDFREAAAMALGIVDRENVATEAETTIRTDETGHLDEIVGKGHFHLERMDDDPWW